MLKDNRSSNKGIASVVSIVSIFVLVTIFISSDIASRPLIQRKDETLVRQPPPLRLRIAPDIPSRPHGPPSPANAAQSSDHTLSYPLPSASANSISLADLRQFADLDVQGPLIEAGAADFLFRQDDLACWGAAKSDGNTTWRSLTCDDTAMQVYLSKTARYEISIRARTHKENAKIGLAIDDADPLFLAFEKPGDHVGCLPALKKPLSQGPHSLRILQSPQTTADIKAIHIRRIRMEADAQETHAFAAVSARNNPPTIEYSIESPAIKQKLASLTFLEGGSVSFPMLLQKEAILSWRLRVTRSKTSTRPVALTIRLIRESEKPEVLFNQRFRHSVDHALHPNTIDLSAHVGRLIRIAFDISAMEPGDRIELIDPRIIATHIAPNRIPWVPPKRVIVFLSDTLRWDKVHFYKPKDNVIKTPHFDRIAREGITFLNAISQGNWSIPSQAAIMGGRYPFDLNMQRPHDTRKADVKLLATAIKESHADVVTASYSSNGYVSDKFGFQQKWDYSRNMIREGKPNKTEYLLSAMRDDWDRDDLWDKPSFTWLGTIDPHVAYSPRPQFLSIYDPEPYSGIVKPYQTAFLLLDIMSGRANMSDRDWFRLHALYHGEISYNDHQLGQLLELLDQRGILDETAIIFVSDHGEEFMEHGGMGHGRSLYDEQIRVPLILYYPRGFPTPRVIESAVETMGIYPTILQMLSAPCPAETQAESLLPYAFGVGPLIGDLSVSNMGAKKHVTAIGPWRLITSSSRTQLFNTQNDAYQKNELTGTRPDVVYYLSARFKEWLYKYRDKGKP